MDKDRYRYFRIEARELLDEMSKATKAMASDDRVRQDPKAMVARMLRLAHTLKGASRVVGQSAIAEHAHAMEDELIPLREAVGPVDAAVLERVVAHIDGIEAALLALHPGLQTGPQAAPANEQGMSTDGGQIQPHAEPDRIGAVLAGVTESHGYTAALRRHTQAVVRARELTDLLLNQLRLKSIRGESALHAVSSLALVEDMARTLRSTLVSLDTGLEQTTLHLARQLKSTKEVAEQLQLAPAQGMLSMLERVARDAARSEGKEIVFKAHGGNVSLDTALLNAVQPALVQMVRNAVAHGIEQTASRRAAGKAAQGLVEVHVAHEGRHVILRCEDDGRGLDRQALLAAGRSKGLVDAQAAEDDATVLSLLLRGGVSTAAQVTELSGRGIGMNVVADVLAPWQGEAFLTTTPGRGTSLTLRFPLKMLSLEVLGLRSQDTHAFVPLEAVVRTWRLARDEVATSTQGQVVIHEGQTMPFLPLSTALGLPLDEPATWTIVVLRAGSEMVALGVDGLAGAAMSVLRPLPAYTPASRVVAGVSLDIEGVPQIVLEPAGLVEAAARWRPSPRDRDVARAVPVLVIDDSLTTRMLVQSILESAGYCVETAVSGEEGLVKARERRHALYLVDVDMPGMDGFTFVQTVRADPALRATPAILVTSRASQEDRDQGKAMGADDYITKGEFDQIAFLNRIGQLIQAAEGVG